MKNGEITVTHVAQEKWSSGTAFLLAAIGSAVGLGNIYRFPYVVGENGGGAFVLLYLGIVAFFGIPLVMTELTLDVETSFLQSLLLPHFHKVKKVNHFGNL